MESNWNPFFLELEMEVSLKRTKKCFAVNQLAWIITKWKNFQIPQSELNKSDINSRFSIIRFKTTKQHKMLKRKKRFVVQLCELIALKLIFLVDMALLKRLLAITNKFNDKTRRLICSCLQFSFCLFSSVKLLVQIVEYFYMK